MGGWNTGVNDQGFLDHYNLMEEYSTDYYSGPTSNLQTTLQVYDVRDISWSTAPTETPGAYYFSALANGDSDWSVSNPSHESIQSETSRLWNPLPLSATDAATSSASQNSFEPIAADTRTAAERHKARSRPSMPHGLPEPTMSSLQRQFTGTTATSVESLNDPNPSQDGLVPRRQDPRFAGDEYTAKWVRGDRLDRAGWCSRCSTWHKLKDSAYWYHMHYSHGISCLTGKSFDLPAAWRSAQGSVGYEALCGGCKQWVVVGRAERWRTPYFRHAYKCQQVKNNPNLQRVPSRPKTGLPRKSATKPSKAA
ncbi:hypothetical protein M409DRAFT_17079 [Zasmidium cellare ATCC 36951]|uniref:Transcription regulator Rua1 C-terminal domain-containing protein n=1 Tax=Zasmidium cellare ATCC 36951 TaxID=1080233 RepID=A0A6A6D4K3_ZASCE|nr:uncharacterized protein M409DRAFT_17079 [Zasmidium cellare ATCC 36951]KAF2173132.1 hypothetical protein M409DRAFT_17079 [Zasmidium cellare ATCC 36951]